MYFESKDWSELNAEEIIIRLGLEDVQVADVEVKEDHHIIKIFGGFNGPALWDVYLHQIGLIMTNLRRSCKANKPRE